MTEVTLDPAWVEIIEVAKDVPAKVTITLTLDEAEELAGILGNGYGWVNHLYYKLSDAGAADYTTAYYRGRDAVRNL